MDSVPDLAVAVDRVLAQLELPLRGEAQVRRWVGNGAEKLLARALTGDLEGQAPAPLLARAKALFEIAYGEHLCVHSRLYPGVAESLVALRTAQLPLACVTNKPAQFTAPLLQRLGIYQHFHTVIAGDSGFAPKKPAPEALWLAAERLGATIAQCLMVGDSATDVQAARNAGCPIACVTYGYNHGRDIRAAAPDAVLDSLAELPPLLLREAA